MPILNPRRMLTTKAMRSLLTSATNETENGFLYEAKAILVTACEINASNNEIISATAAGAGMGAGQTLTFGSYTPMSAGGKIYSVSNVVGPVSSGVGGAQTIIGIVLTVLNLAADMLAFLEFDDPITVDENGESIQFAIEAGFDGQKFYVRERVLPAGM